jgi:hypothetical protein
MGCVLVGMRDQLLVSVGEIRREFGDRLVEAVEVANQSSLVVVVRGPAAVGELPVDRREEGIVEPPRVDRAFPALECAGERSDGVALDLGRDCEMIGHAIGMARTGSEATATRPVQARGVCRTL